MSWRADTEKVLAGDIGGTKTHIALFSGGKSRPSLKVIQTYSSGKFKGLDQIIERFIKVHPSPVKSACFAIAGPVVRGRCRATNLPWVVSERRMKSRFGWPHVQLINDLASTALAIPRLASREISPLNRARTQKGGPIGLVAPGTGLGEALLISHRGRHIPLATEGGHVDFPANTQEEAALWQYLHARLGHVSIERVVSGPGLFNIYSWLKDSGQYSEPRFMRRRIASGDPPEVIARAAIQGAPPICVAALNRFMAVLGAVAGNLALIGLTYGGLYLGGGIPPKILPALRQGPFMRAFTDKGRFQDLLKRIPVRVILNDKACLLGAAWAAFEREREGQEALFQNTGGTQSG